MQVRTLINFRGDLFATVLSFTLQALMRLGSSLLLTRLLRPEAYGLFAILISIIFVVDMLSDIGVWGFIVRQQHGSDPAYLNTAWTLKFGRSLVNMCLVLIAAPYIASLYSVPDLALPLRVFSISFVIHGIESMSFAIAARNKNSRVIVFSELAANMVATIFTVIVCFYTRTYWGMIYGTLLNRAIYTALSYAFYPEVRPKIHFDKRVAIEFFSFTKFVMPSSMLTLALTQFDKIAFLRLFDLKLLGVYGLAGNIAGPIEGLISKVSQLVLYPRCAYNFRTDPATYTLKYYTDNVKLFAAILSLPAIIGGFSGVIIGLLYDPRYALAAPILTAFMLRASLLSLASPAEDFLFAAGDSSVVLVGNILRTAWVVIASLLGFKLFGFLGFTYGIALSGLPPLAYYLVLQFRRGGLILRYELYKVALALTIALLSFLASRQLMSALASATIKTQYPAT